MEPAGLHRGSHPGIAGRVCASKGRNGARRSSAGAGDAAMLTLCFDVAAIELAYHWQQVIGSKLFLDRDVPGRRRATMEPAADAREHVEVVAGLIVPTYRPQWSPPRTAGGLGVLQQPVSRLRLAAMGPAADRREHDKGARQ
jgi:hypothetical protein